MSTENVSKMLQLLTSPDAPTVTATHFKNACAEGMEAVALSHRTLLVTKHGKPYVQIVPADPVPTDPVGFMAGTVVAAHDLVSPDPDAWESSDMDPLAQP